MKPRFYIMEHRARCKHCGKKPSHYSYTSGANLSSTRTIKGVNRFRNDMIWYPDTNQWAASSELVSNAQYMRRVNVRGVCSTNPYIFKQIKNNYISYRIIFTCECRKSIWMFPVNSFNDNHRNRKLLGNPRAYKDAGYIGKVNTRW